MDRSRFPSTPIPACPRAPILHRGHGIVAATNTDYNQVGGNCGISWIRVSQTGTNKAAVVKRLQESRRAGLSTGAGHVSLSDKNGTSHQTHCGANVRARRRPGSGRISTSTALPSTTSHAGGAALDDGTICLSGAPDVSINLDASAWHNAAPGWTPGGRRRPLVIRPNQGHSASRPGLAAGRPAMTPTRRPTAASDGIAADAVSACRQ